MMIGDPFNEDEPLWSFTLDLDQQNPVFVGPDMFYVTKSTNSGIDWESAYYARDSGNTFAATGFVAKQTTTTDSREGWVAIAGGDIEPQGLQYKTMFEDKFPTTYTKYETSELGVWTAEAPEEGKTY